MRRYYQILGVSSNATSEEIRAAWLFSIKAFHPDKFSGSSLHQQRIADERTKAINEAYSVLSDPHRRAAYDRDFAQQGRAGTARASAAPPKEEKPSPPPQPATHSPRAERTPSHRRKALARLARDVLGPSGRIGRAQFIVRAVIISLASYIAILVCAALKVALVIKSDFAASVTGLLTLLGMYLLAVQAGKRLHDADHSAGWIFAGVTGIGAMILPFIVFFQNGTVGPNRFGSRSITPRGMKIFASILGGISLLGVCVLLGISESRNAKTGPASSRSSSIAATPTVLSQPREQIVKGTDIPYSLMVPHDWTVKRKGQIPKEASSDIDVMASQNVTFIAVVAEEADLGDEGLVVRLTQESLSKANSDATFSKSEPVSIDGRMWQAFTVHLSVSKVPFAYRYYVYTGPEGTFQLMGWTFANLYSRDLGKLQKVMQSFKFPTMDTAAKTITSKFGPNGSILFADKSKFDLRNTSRNATPTPKARETDHNDVWDLPRIASMARPAVVFLVVSDATGKAIKTGTGFFVGSDGELVTNWHVLSGGVSAIAKTENGTTYRIAGILAFSAKSDIAILKVDARNVPFLTLAADDTIRVGDRVAVIGSPLGFEGTLSEGIVSSLRGDRGSVDWLQMTAAVSHGSSGSPVLSAKGQIVGVATWVMSKEGAQALNFARPAAYVSALMTKLTPNDSPRALAEVFAPPTKPPMADKSPSPARERENSTDSLRGERFPETRKRSLTLQEVRNWNDDKLRYAINEIYARHGAEIENPMVRKQFSGFDWYRPVPGKTYDAAENEFSAVEKYNVHLLVEYRKVVRRKGTQPQQIPTRRPPPTPPTWPGFPFRP